jgi:hypothetical protein
MARRELLHPMLVFAVAVLALGITTQAFFAHGGQVEPETPNFVYYMNPKDDSVLPLERETPEMAASSNSLTGAVEGQMSVLGQKSPVRIAPNQKVEFVVRPAEPSKSFGIRFERFEVKGGKRTLKFVKDPKPSSSADRPGLLAFETTHTAKASIKISVAYDLPPGEYGITVSPHGAGPKVFCFGID